MAGFKQPCPVEAHCYENLGERNQNLIKFLKEKHPDKPVLIFGAKDLEEYFTSNLEGRKVIDVKDEKDMYKVNL